MKLSYDIQPGIFYIFIKLNQVLNKEAFEKQMLEKLIWISAFMLVGARHPGATVGVVEKEFRSEVKLHLTIMYVRGNQGWIYCISLQRVMLNR